VRQARYRQIHQQLRNAILSGEYKPGDKLPTEKELAALHGVSRVTSAAALAELAREGLVQRLPRRGTTVAAPATHEAPGGSPIIGWIQPAIDPSFGLEVLRGIERAARAAGYHLLIYLTGNSRAEEEHAIRQAVAAGAAGLAIFLQDGETYNDEVLRLVLRRFPLVLVDRYLRGLPCACVQSDNVAGVREAVTALIEAGHRDICILTFPPRDTSTIEDRLDGYAQALAMAGLPLDHALIYSEPQLPDDVGSRGEIADDIVDRLAAYMRRAPHLTAIFATNVALTLLALRAAARLGRHVPTDLSIIGVDPLQNLPLPLSPITYVEQQSMEIGRVAITLLQEQLAGASPRRVTLPMRLTHAGTIAPPLSMSVDVTDSAVSELSLQDSVVRGIDQMAHHTGGAGALLRRRP